MQKENETTNFIPGVSIGVGKILDIDIKVNENGDIILGTNLSKILKAIKSAGNEIIKSKQSENSEEREERLLDWDSPSGPTQEQQ